MDKKIDKRTRLKIEPPAKLCHTGAWQAYFRVKNIEGIWEFTKFLFMKKIEYKGTKTKYNKRR